MTPHVMRHHSPGRYATESVIKHYYLQRKQFYGHNSSIGSAINNDPTAEQMQQTLNSFSFIVKFNF